MKNLRKQLRTGCDSRSITFPPYFPIGKTEEKVSFSGRLRTVNFPNLAPSKVEKSGIFSSIQHYLPDQLVYELLGYPNRKCFCRSDFDGNNWLFSAATLITPIAICQTHLMDATISWLSQARSDCYPHEQSLTFTIMPFC
jgi:hypothetical protein